MKLWKIIGLAGIAGVATAAGVTAVRRRRSWEEVAPDDLRDRLHQRLADSTAGPGE